MQTIMHPATHFLPIPSFFHLLSYLASNNAPLNTLFAFFTLLLSIPSFVYSNATCHVCLVAEMASEDKRATELAIKDSDADKVLNRATKDHNKDADLAAEVRMGQERKKIRRAPHWTCDYYVG